VGHLTADEEREHGTYGTYQWEIKNFGEACDECKAARNAYIKRYRQKKPSAGSDYNRRRLRALTILRERHPKEFTMIMRELLMEEKRAEATAASAPDTNPDTSSAKT
jgi:hypothetical protein